MKWPFLSISFFQSVKLSVINHKRLVQLQKMFYSIRGTNHAILGGDHDDKFILYRTLKELSYSNKRLVL